MESENFVGASFEKSEGYSDLVTFIYDEGDNEREVMCTIRFTYHPEIHEWTHEISENFSNTGRFEKVAGIEDSAFPALMRKRLRGNFEARETFYNAVHALLKEDEIKVVITHFLELPHGKTKCSITAECIGAELELVLSFGETGILRHFSVQDQKRKMSQNFIKFEDAAPFPAIVKIDNYLREQSEYRMKLMLL